MNRKSLFAGVLALSFAGLAGVAAASDLQLSPYGKEALESGLYPAGTPAHQTVAGETGPALQFVNREASEGLQGSVTEVAAATQYQTVERAQSWLKFEQEAAYRGR